MHVLTSQEAFRGAGAAAGWLKERQIRPGERVAVCMSMLAMPSGQAAKHQASTIQIVLGCLVAGVTPVMVNPALSSADRQYILSDCQPSATITADHFAEVLAHEEVPTPREFTARPMHYTSGTTGVAKGVWAGHLPPELLVDWWTDESQAWPFDAADTTIVCGPLVHSAPLRFPLLTLLAGGSVALFGAFETAALSRAIVECQPTTAFVVPTHLQRLLGQVDPAPSSFRLLAHAGAACPAELKRATHSWAGAKHVWEFYGSTEGQFTQCHGPEWELRPGTLGRARDGRRLLTDDGVIWCQPPAASQFEYWNDRAKTAEAWRDLPDGGRAFTVGDLGRIDDDGYLFFQGRRTDLIITGGVNVYPMQVESVIAEFAGVQECAVFAEDDEEWGQVVCVAFVGTTTKEDVLARARVTLAKHQVPKRAVQLAELPRNANGKLQRAQLSTRQ